MRKPTPSSVAVRGVKLTRVPAGLRVEVKSGGVLTHVDLDHPTAERLADALVLGEGQAGPVLVVGGLVQVAGSSVALRPADRARLVAFVRSAPRRPDP